MSTSNRTRLEVQKILGDNITSALSAFGLTDWRCSEFANPSIQNMDGVVLMNFIKSNRVGWQEERSEVVDGNLTRIDGWIEQQSWQIHTIAKRTSSTTDSSILAEDVSGWLITWFNGKGCEYFRANGMANLRIDPNSILVYNDNSNLYQKRAVFTVKIQVPKEITFEQNSVDEIIPEVQPI